MEEPKLAGIRKAVSTLGSSLGLWIFALLYAVTSSHATSITWILMITPERAGTR